MRKDDAVLIGLGILLVLGALLLRDGVTGAAVFDYKNSCQVNAQCGIAEVCCLFYGENYGVCDELDSCGLIRDMSRVEKEIFDLRQGTIPVRVEQPAQIQEAQDRSVIVTVIGVLLIILVFYYYFRFERTKRKKPRRKSSTRRRKK